MFRVDPKTVTRWARAGKLSCIRTLGGHRRYREREVKALLRKTDSDVYEIVDVAPEHR
jgi:excisionase family DNA binding protein